MIPFWLAETTSPVFRTVCAHLSFSNNSKRRSRNHLINKLLINISEVYYGEMLNSDPEIVTSLRYLSQDKKNPFTKAVTRACKRVGLLGPDEPLDPSRPLTKGVFVSVQVMSNNPKLHPRRSWFISAVILMLRNYLMYLS